MDIQISVRGICFAKCLIIDECAKQVLIEKDLELVASSKVYVPAVAVKISAITKPKI